MRISSVKIWCFLQTMRDRTHCASEPRIPLFLSWSSFLHFFHKDAFYTHKIYIARNALPIVFETFSKYLGSSWLAICKNSSYVLLFLIKIFTTSTLIWTRVVTEQHLLRRQGHNLFWGPGAGWGGAGGVRIWRGYGLPDIG